MRTIIWTAALCLALPACDTPDEQSDSALSVADPTGVAVVEQTIDPSHAIRLEEEFRLGSVQGDESQQFFRVRDAELGPNDDLWILDSGNNLVKVFGLDGAFRFSFGRRGSGPGEFQGSATSLTIGPTVVVSDINGRVHSFDLSGSHVETVSLRSNDPSLQVGRPEWTSSGLVAPVWRQFDTETREWLEPRPLRLLEVDFDGGVPAPTGFEWQMAFGSTLVGSIGWIIEPLFRQAPTYALDGRGRVHLIETDEYQLDLYRSDGTLERRVRNQGERVPVTEADIDAYVASRRERCPRNASREGEACMFLEEAVPAVLAMPTPEFRAAVGQLHASAAGDVLVLREDIDPNPWEAGDDEAYDLFDADGRYRGRFTRPGTFGVLRLYGDRLIAVERDELDVEQVVVYRIVGGEL